MHRPLFPMTESERARYRVKRSIRRHYSKLYRQAEHLKGECSHCHGEGCDFAGEDCRYCDGSGKAETPAWYAFMLLRGAPRWLVNGDESPAEQAESEGE